MKEPEWIEQTIYQALSADGELGELLGLRKKGIKDKVFPGVIPQGTKLPAVTYQRTYSRPEKTLLGYQSEQVSITVTAFSSSFGEAQKIAKRIRAIMAAEPVNGDFGGDSHQVDPESNTHIISAEYICVQTGGYCYGGKL